MLVDNSIYRNAYVANGSSKSFAISFPFLTAEHIQVFRGVEDENDMLIPASEYTISGAGNENGGTLVMNTAPASGTRIVILRNVPITQLYAYEELDNFSAESHEDALAKLTMIDQQQQEQIDRSIKIPVTDERTPEQYAQELFESRSEAKRWAEYAKAQADRTVQILGETEVLATGTTSPRALQERFADVVNVKDFGAKGDGASDDTKAFQAARTAAGIDNAVFIPRGAYTLSESIPGTFVADEGAIVSGAPLRVVRPSDLLTISLEDSLSPGRFFTYDYPDALNNLQGYCIGGNYLYFVRMQNDTNGELVKVDLTDNTIVSSVSHDSLGHANGMAYADGMLYVAAYPTATIAKYDATTLAYVTSFDLGFSCGAVGFDPQNREFVCLEYGAPAFRFYDESFSVLRHRVIAPAAYTKSTTQGLEYRDGLVYLALSASVARKNDIENVSAILAMNRSGKIVKRWYLSGRMGELEDVGIHNDTFILGFNGDFKKVSFWRASYKKAAYAPDEITMEQANAISAPSHTQKTGVVIYVDASASEGGTGTSARPFKRMKDAISALQLWNHPGRIEIQASGDFTSEGVVRLAGFDRAVWITGGTFSQIEFYNCKHVRITGATIDMTLGNAQSGVFGTVGIQVEETDVDIRNSIFIGSVGTSSKAIAGIRNRVYLLNSSEFTNFDSCVYMQQGTLLAAADHAFSGCTHKVQLVESVGYFKTNELKQSMLTGYSGAFIFTGV